MVNPSIGRPCFPMRNFPARTHGPTRQGYDAQGFLAGRRAAGMRLARSVGRVGTLIRGNNGDDSAALRQNRPAVQQKGQDE